MNLRYKTKAVRKFEKENKTSIFELINDNSLDNIVKLIQLGEECDEERAENILDTELSKEDADTMTIFMDILGELQKCGFLPKKLSLLALKMQMLKAMEQMNTQIEEGGLEAFNTPIGTEKQE